ncbi:MAG: alpha-ketoacid dehydrogenase subunit beta [Firmicutes bacterium]|nr:alpha-ketoacid dehydrogenase subunit beta [Bacillota bacterium]
MRKISYAQALNEALREEMDRDPAVFLMGEDVGAFGNVFFVAKGLLDKYGPDRVRDTPISEQAIVATGLGAALAGARPVVEIMFIDFATMAMDPIVNQAAKMRYHSGGTLKAPMVIRTQGGVGRGNGSQHSQSLEAWFMHIPGLKVVMPSTPYDAKGLLKSAIRDDDPVVFIEHKRLYGTWGEVPEEEYTVPIGEAAVRRQGGDVTIIAASRQALLAEDAARILESEGIHAEVIDLRSISPLDRETIGRSVRKTGRTVIVHEACKTGGIGAELTAVVLEEAFYYLDAPVIRVTGEDVPIPFNADLEAAAIPSVDKIVSGVKSILQS